MVDPVLGHWLRWVNRWALVGGLSGLTGCMNVPLMETTALRPATETPAPLGAGSPGLAVVPAPDGNTSHVPTRPQTPDMAAVPLPKTSPTRIPVPISPRGPAGADGTTPSQLELSIKAPQRQQTDGAAVYRITVKNAGTIRRENLSILCEFDPALTFDQSLEKQVLQPVGPLLPQESKEIALSLSSSQVGRHCCRFGVIEGESRDLSARTTQSACVDFIPRQIQVNMVRPAARTVGSRAEFNIVVANRTLQKLHDVVVSTSYDAALVPKELTEGASREEGRLSWKLGTLEPYETAPLQVEFECRTAAHRACVQLEVRARDLPDDRWESCLEIVPVTGTLDVQVSDRLDPLDVGKQGAYDITVRNIGLQPVRNIVVEATASPFVRILGGVTSLGEEVFDLPMKIDGQRVIFDPLTELAPDAVFRCRVEVEGTDEGTAELTATVTADQNPASTVTVSEPTSVMSDK